MCIYCLEQLYAFSTLSDLAHAAGVLSVAEVSRAASKLRWPLENSLA